MRQSPPMLSNHKLMAVLMACVLGYILWTARPVPVTPWCVAGGIIATAALGFWIAARMQLGNSFAVSAQARQLVTTGLYSKIRNPIYFFGALFMLGVILYVQRFWLLLVFLVVIPLQIVRARREALVLEAKFGDQYRHYRAGTWF